MENPAPPSTTQKKALADPYVGKVLDGRFDILSVVGRGSTSTVYRATDLSNAERPRFVAIKMLHAHLAFDEGLVARFEREARAAKILAHHNIAQISEYATTESGTPYLVEEFVEGESLLQILARRDHLSTREATTIFEQLCAGLAAAHDKGIVHRDLKPANIMIIDRSDKDIERIPQVKILDFGCAKLMVELGDTVLRKTQTGEMLGSLLYMSPEQCLDGEVDGRSDIYALGCVLYESITGKPPLAARTAFETMNKQLATMPASLHHTRPDLSFDKNLEAVIFKAMAKAPDKRYQKVTEMMDDLIAVRENRELEKSHISAGQIAPMPRHGSEVAHYQMSKLPIAQVLRIGFWAYCACGFLGLAFAFFTTAPSVPLQVMVYVLAFLGFLIAGVSASLKPSKQTKTNTLLHTELKAAILNDSPKLSEWDINRELFIQLGYTKTFKYNGLRVFGGRIDADGGMAIKVGWPNRPETFMAIKPVKEHDIFWRNLCFEYPATESSSRDIIYVGATVELLENNPVQSLKSEIGSSFLYINAHLARIC